METDRYNTVTELYKPLISLQSALSYIPWTNTEAEESSIVRSATTRRITKKQQAEVRPCIYYSKINTVQKFNTWLFLHASTNPHPHPSYMSLTSNTPRLRYCINNNRPVSIKKILIIWYYKLSPYMVSLDINNQPSTCNSYAFSTK
jgi:hypothetical protein